MAPRKTASKKVKKKTKVTQNTQTVENTDAVSEENLGQKVGDFGSADLGKLLRVIKVVEERGGLSPIEIEFVKLSFERADRLLSRAEELESPETVKEQTPEDGDTKNKKQTIKEESE